MKKNKKQKNHQFWAGKHIYTSIKKKKPQHYFSFWKNLFPSTTPHFKINVSTAVMSDTYTAKCQLYHLLLVTMP